MTRRKSKVKKKEEIFQWVNEGKTKKEGVRGREENWGKEGD